MDKDLHRAIQDFQRGITESVQGITHRLERSQFPYGGVQKVKEAISLLREALETLEKKAHRSKGNYSLVEDTFLVRHRDTPGYILMVRDNPEALVCVGDAGYPLQYYAYEISHFSFRRGNAGALWEIYVASEDNLSPESHLHRFAEILVEKILTNKYLDDVE